MATTPEGKVKDAAKKLLMQSGCYWFMPVSNGMGRVGIPDFIVCQPIVVTPQMVGMRIGRFAGLEAKAPGKLNTLTPNQQREISGIQAASGIALAFDDVSVLASSLEVPR